MDVPNPVGGTRSIARLYSGSLSHPKLRASDRIFHRRFAGEASHRRVQEASVVMHQNVRPAARLRNAFPAASHDAGTLTIARRHHAVA